jgi:hypothetical protein
MKQFFLKRLSTGIDGTPGVIMEGLTPFAVTLEPEWLDNKPNMSCIPAGLYRCERVQSPRFGMTFEITEVVGRTHVLFHKGNTEKDTIACVLVGEQFDPIDGKFAIKQSGKGFGELMQRLDGEKEFALNIMWA